MDTQPMPPLAEPDRPTRETRRPWWRCGGDDYGDLTWLWVILFITSSSTSAADGTNPVAWLVMGVSAGAGLLWWWAARCNRR
jgi:hypothetical protein